MITINNFININEHLDIQQGKYASKVKDFYKELDVFQHNKMIYNYDIRPIQFTFEITNRCNCNCPSCGMNANRVKPLTLNIQTIKKIIDDLYEIGIPSIAYTGGEPFLEFKTICESIRYAKNKIDTIKIISNGFWGNNPKYYFDKLIESGLFDNKLFVPSIYISIGEQEVPLESICNLIKYVCDNELYKQINFGIINTRHLNEEYSQLERLFELYNLTYGEIPDNKLYLTDSTYINSNNLEHKNDTNKLSCLEAIQYCDNRFLPQIGKYVSPKILMKCNGDCYPCEIFDYNKEICIGNYFDDGIDKIIENYNHNKIVLFIRKYGVDKYKDIIPKNILESTKVESACQACKFCSNFIIKNNLLNI